MGVFRHLMENETATATELASVSGAEVSLIGMNDLIIKD